MKCLLTFFTILVSGLVCGFAAPGDLEYLIAREYENAGTWKERVLALVDRRVETEDYIKFIEAPEDKYLKEVLPVQYKTISGSGRLFEETDFPLKPSRYASALEFNDSFYYKHLTAFDYFLKLELIGILCNPENEIAEDERLELLVLLWSEIYREQAHKESIYKKNQTRALESICPVFCRYKKRNL